MKLNDFIPQYKEYKTKTCKISSVSAYMLLIRNYIKPILGEYELSEISNKEAEILKASCEGKGMSRKSVEDVIIVLKNILKIAQYLEVADTKKITVLWATANIEKKNVVETYSKDQVKKLVDYLESNPSFENLGILLTIYSGMRIGEVCALQWKNVDMEEKVIHVKATMQRIYVEDENGTLHTEISISSPKTQSSQREIPLVPKVYKIMKDFNRICKPNYYVNSGKVKPIEPRTFRNYYNKVISDLGLPKLKFHGLRHTFATQMLSAKADVKVLSTILGHHDIATTLNIYVHPSQDDKRNAMAKLKF